jgi:hypothetical protein
MIIFKYNLSSSWFSAPNPQWNAPYLAKPTTELRLQQLRIFSKEDEDERLKSRRREGIVLQSHDEAQKALLHSEESIRVCFASQSFVHTDGQPGNKGIP